MERYDCPPSLWRQALAPIQGSEIPYTYPSFPRATRTVAEGFALQCLGGGGTGFRYPRNLMVEVLRSERTRDGLFYLVVTSDGCAGWVPARHLPGSLVPFSR